MSGISSMSSRDPASGVSWQATSYENSNASFTTPASAPSFKCTALTRLRHLEHRRPDAPSLTDESGGQIESLGGEIVAEQSRRRFHSSFVAPVVVVLTCVRVDRLVFSPVYGPVGLIVAAEVHATERHPPAHRVLPNGSSKLAASPLDATNAADIHREYPWHRHLARGLSLANAITVFDTLLQFHLAKQRTESRMRVQRREARRYSSGEIATVKRRPVYGSPHAT